MSVTPPPQHRRQTSTASSTADTPATPSTPYHSVRESITDTSDFSDDGSVDHFSDATEGRPSLEEPFGGGTLTTSFQKQGIRGSTEEDEDEEGSHTPHVEKAPILFPVPSFEHLADKMASEESEIWKDEKQAVGSETETAPSDTPVNGRDSEPSASVDSIAIPTLVVDKTSDDHPVYGTVEGTKAQEKRSMDAEPDFIQEYEDSTLTNGHPNPKASPVAFPAEPFALPAPGPSESDPGIPPISSTAAVPETGSENGFDDDFDDFGETVEGDDGFDDFGDFDTAEPSAVVEQSQAEAEVYQEQVLTSSLPDFSKLSTDEVKSRIDEIIASLYTQSETPAGGNTSLTQPLPPTNSAFLTERSQSLWTQLCTPPPLQPPNWKLSRIRRLFLVSLGVPVDLDEILPAGTKQKKLVLPSSSTARKSSDAGRSDSEKSRQTSSQRRKDKNAPAKLVDVPAARILCSTSDVKLNGFTVEELEDHVKKLEEITKETSETLTYWLQRRETALSDKKAFETVIDNLVDFAKKKKR